MTTLQEIQVTEENRGPHSSNKTTTGVLIYFQPVIFFFKAFYMHMMFHLDYQFLVYTLVTVKSNLHKI